MLEQFYLLSGHLRPSVRPDSGGLTPLFHRVYEAYRHRPKLSVLCLRGGPPVRCLFCTRGGRTETGETGSASVDRSTVHPGGRGGQMASSKEWMFMSKASGLTDMER